MVDPIKGFGDLPVPEPQPESTNDYMAELEKVFDLPGASLFREAELEEVFGLPPETRRPPEQDPLGILPKPEDLIATEPAVQIEAPTPEVEPDPTPLIPKVTPTSDDPQRSNFLSVVGSDKYGETARDSALDAYVSRIVEESTGRMFSRPQNDRYRKEQKDRIRQAAEGIYRSNILATGESEPLMDIVARLESEKTAIGLMDPYSPMPREYARNLLQEELMSSDLDAATKARIFSEVESRFDKIDPDIDSQEDIADRFEEAVGDPQTYLIETSGIPMNKTIAGDTVKALGSTSKIVGAPIAMGVGAAASMFPDRYYAAGEKPLETSENFASGLPSATNLINWRKSGNTPSVPPGEILGQMVEGKAPRVNEQAFKDATELSIRGEGIDTREGRFRVPLRSAADIISGMNAVADNEELIKRKLGNILMSDETKEFYVDPDSGNIAAQAKAHRESLAFQERVNRLYNRYSSAPIYGEELKDVIPDEDADYVRVFEPYFPRDTKSSEIAETIDYASDIVFDRGILQEIKPYDLDSIQAMAKDGDPRFVAINEMLQAVPEDQREQTVQALFGDESLQFIKGAFTGELSKDTQAQRAIFTGLASRYIQKESDEQIKELARTGQLGEAWEGRGLDPKSRDAFHSAVPALLTIEQIAQTPEFQDDAEAYWAHLGTGLAELPYHMNVSAIAVLDKIFGEDALRNYGVSQDMIDGARVKWEDDPALVIADWAAVTAGAGRLIRQGVVEGTPKQVILDSLDQLEGPSSIVKAAGEDLPSARGPKTKTELVDAELSKPVDPSDVVIYEAKQDPTTGVYDLGQGNLTYTTVKAEVVVSPTETYTGYRRELASVEQQLQQTPKNQEAQIESLRIRKRELEKLIETNRDLHQQDRQLFASIDAESPQTGTVEPVTQEVAFSSDAALARIQDEGFSMEALQGPPSSPSKTVRIGGEKLTYKEDPTLSNPDGTKRLASTNRNNEITLNPVESTQEFFDYFTGKIEGPSSKQKQLTLAKLEEQGFGLDRIKAIIRTPQDANKFLLLHELDHVINNDRANYWAQGRDLLTPDKIEIETRATVNALQKVRMSQLEPARAIGNKKGFLADFEVISDFKAKGGNILENKQAIKTLQEEAKKAGIKEGVLGETAREITREDGTVATTVNVRQALTPAQTETLTRHMIQNGVDNLQAWTLLFEMSFPKPSLRSNASIRKAFFDDLEASRKAAREAEDPAMVARDLPDEAPAQAFSDVLSGAKIRLKPSGMLSKYQGTKVAKYLENEGITDNRTWAEVINKTEKPLPPKLRKKSEEIGDLDQALETTGPQLQGPDWMYDVVEHLHAARRQKELKAGGRIQREQLSPDVQNRIEFNASRITRRLNMFERMDKNSPEYKQAITDATKKLDYYASAASGYRVGNYTTMSGTHRMIKALRDQNIKDIVVWRTLFDRSAIGTVKNETIGRYIADIEEAQYQRGTEARAGAIEQIDPYGPISKDGPMQILARETRENPRIVNNKLDSLTIAETLANSGDVRPESYFGLNLTAKEQSGFIAKAEGIQKKAAIIQKTFDEISGKRFQEGGLFGERFDQGGLVGARIEVDPKTHSIMPRKLRGVKGETGLTRFSRVAGRVILGDEGYNALNAGRKTQLPAFNMVAVAEAMKRPFAIINAPKWYRLGAAEMVLHARAEGWSGWSGNAARLFFENLAKGSLTLGDEMYYAIKKSEGDFHLDISALDKRFSEPLNKFVVTNEKVRRVLGAMKDLKGDDITLDALQIHQLGHIIHRNITDVKIVDNRTLKEYQLSKIMEPVVNVKDLRFLELNIVDSIINSIEKSLKNNKKLNDLPIGQVKVDEYRLQALKNRSRDLKSQLQATSIDVPTHLAFPKLNMLKADLDAAFKKRDFKEVGRIKDQIAIYNQFTNDVVVSNVSGMRYRLKKPAATLDDFEKAMVVFANDIVKPRINYMFDLVTQLLVGEDTVKLMFDTGKGFQNIVARKTVTPTGQVKYEVVKEFKPTFEGQTAATAFANKLNPEPARVSTALGKKPQTGDLISNQAHSEAGARSTIGSVGKYVTITKDTLSKGVARVKPPKKGRELSVHGTDLIDRSMGWLSTFYEAHKLNNLIERTLLEAKALRKSDEAIQMDMRRLARAVLSGIDGGQKLLKKHGGDEAKAINELVKMSDREAQRMFGSSLRENERFFMKRAYAENFNSRDFLAILSDYNLSFFKTSNDIINNIHQLKLVNKFRRESKVLTESEWETLPPSIQRQWVKADEVVSKPGDYPVFSHTLSGARVHTNVAEYFSRQVGLQKAQDLSLMKNMSGPVAILRRLAAGASQYTKVNLLLDVINNTVLRNKLGASLVQSIAHSEYVMDPRYLIKTIKMIRGLKKGTVDVNSLPPKFVDAMKMYVNGNTSLKAEFYKTKQGRLWRDLMLDAGDYAARQNLQAKINAVDSPDATVAIQQLADVLSLKGFDKEIASFFEALRTQDLEAPSNEGFFKKQTAEALERIGIARDAFIAFYSSIDGWYKTAYHWYLTDRKSFAAPQAFKESNKTYVNYGDMSPLINYFRFGFGNVAASQLTQEFIGFAANQVPNHWDFITNRPIRSWILGHMSEAYDRAVEETLKFALTTDELRHLFRDPTLRMTLFTPGAEKQTGFERGPYFGQTGGLPYLYSGSGLTGVPSSLPGAEEFGPLIPVDPKSLYFGTPLKNDYRGPEDYKITLNNFSRVLGGFINSITETGAQRQSAKKLSAKQDLELAEKYETFEDEDKTPTQGGVLAAIVRRMVPRLFQSGSQAASAAAGRPVFGFSKPRSSVLGSFLGFSGKQANVNDILDTDIIPKDYRRSIQQEYKKWQDSITPDSPQGDIDRAVDVSIEFEKLDQYIADNKERLDQAQLQAIEDIRIAVLAKMMEGKITLEELLEVFGNLDQ